VRKDIHFRLEALFSFRLLQVGQIQIPKAKQGKTAFNGPEFINTGFFILHDPEHCLG